MKKKSVEVEITEAVAEYFDDPLGYVMFVFPWDTDASIQKVKLVEPWKTRYGCEYGPDKWACEFLDDLGQDIKNNAFDGKKTAQPLKYTTASGHGIGKSVMVAWLIKFIMDTRPFSMGVVTANTGDQLRTKTWAELAKWHSISITAGMFTYTNSRGSMAFYRNGPKEIQAKWRCEAQTCREENSEAFAGLHAADGTPFYIFDEASAVPDTIFEVREGGQTDGEPMIFDFGNPTRKSGRFYENCVGKFAHRYKFRQIDSRSVQVTNKSLFEEWAHDWGEDSDFFKVRVKGEFPSQGSLQFIGTDPVYHAMRRPAPPHEVTRLQPLFVGVDVARFGDNQTIIYPRLGMDARTLPYKAYGGLTIPQVAEKVIETLQEYHQLGRKCDGLFVDGGGLGAGVVDILRDLGYNVVDVNGGRAATGSSFRYHAHELWGRMRESLDKLVLPNDPKLLTQLTQREYGFVNDSSVMMLESKKDMQKRGVDSPDIADALALTFSSAPMASVYHDITGGQQQFAESEYNPLEMKY